MGYMPITAATGQPFIHCPPEELPEGLVGVEPECSVISLAGAKPVIPESCRLLWLMFISILTKSPLLMVDRMLMSSGGRSLIMTTSLARDAWLVESGVEVLVGLVGGFFLSWIVVTDKSDVKGNACSGSLYGFLDWSWNEGIGGLDCIHGS